VVQNCGFRITATPLRVTCKANTADGAAYEDITYNCEAHTTLATPTISPTQTRNLPAQSYPISLLCTNVDLFSSGTTIDTAGFCSRVRARCEAQHNDFPPRNVNEESMNLCPIPFIDQTYTNAVPNPTAFCDDPGWMLSTTYYLHSEYYSKAWTCYRLSSLTLASSDAIAGRLYRCVHRTTDALAFIRCDLNITSPQITQYLGNSQLLAKRCLSECTDTTL
jgi:hypothetical protein